MFFHCLPVSRKYRPNQRDLGLERESRGHLRRAHHGRAHLYHSQRCRGPRAIDHVGLAMDMLSF